jgi:hypothetical protein
MDHFRDYVSSNFKPKITWGSKFVPKKAITPLDGLSTNERASKGNEYMEIAK